MAQLIILHSIYTAQIILLTIIIHQVVHVMVPFFFSFTPSSTGLVVYKATKAYNYIMVITTLKVGYVSSSTCQFSFEIQSYSLSGVLSLGSDYCV